MTQPSEYFMSPSSEGSPRFFIAGATGYTGQHLVREAAQHGMHTVAHIRPDSSQRERCTKEFESHGALIDTSPWEEEALVEASSSQGEVSINAP